MSDQRFNTGNPIGSNSPLDRSDNTRNLDEAVLSSEDTFQDRLGQSRLTFAGMQSQFSLAQELRNSRFQIDQAERASEFDADQVSRDQRFNTFIASSGYQFLGEYGPGIELTEYNQLVRDENGEFWRVSGQVDLPYVTTGAGIPEGDALVPAGDAVLRQQLASPDMGALMVRGAVIYVDTIADLQSLPTSELVDGQEIRAQGSRFKWRDGEALPLGPVRSRAWGVTRDAIQSAMDYAALHSVPLIITKGDYTLPVSTANNLGLDIPSNVTIRCEKGVTFTVDNPENLTSYRTVNINNREHVTIEGMVLVGDRDVNTSTTGEQGHGFYIVGSSHVKINGGHAKNFWGDGFYVGLGCSDVELLWPVSDNNRRQGLSVTGVDGMYVKRGVFKNSNGTAPEAGVDFETTQGYSLANIVFDQCRAENNAGVGFDFFVSGSILNNEGVYDITLNNPVSVGNERGYWMRNAQSKMFGRITLNNPTAEDCVLAGIEVRRWSVDAAPIHIDRPIVKRCGTPGGTSSPITITAGSVETVDAALGNVFIDSPDITLSDGQSGSSIYIRNEANPGNRNIEKIYITGISGNVEDVITVSPSTNVRDGCVFRSVRDGYAPSVISGGNRIQDSRAYGTTPSARHVSASTVSEASGAMSQVGASSYSRTTGTNSAILASRGTENTLPYHIVAGYSSETVGPSTANRTLAFRVSTGRLQIAGSLEENNAFGDIAEVLPNAEGVPHEPGVILTLAPSGVAPAEAGDDVVGVVSATAGVVLGASEFCWQGRYLRDEWGCFVTREVTHVSFRYRNGHNETVEYAGPVSESPVDVPTDAVYATFDERVENPEWDASIPQVGRLDRPAEYTVVGILGQVLVRVDDSVSPGDYVTPLGSGVGQQSDRREKIKCFQITSAYRPERGFAIARCFIS